MGRKRRARAVVKTALRPDRVPAELTADMLGLPEEELRMLREDEKLRALAVVIDAYRRYGVAMSDGEAAAEVIYRLALELDDAKRGVTRDRRKWAAAMNAGLHAAVVAAANGGPVREAIFVDLFRRRSSLDFISPGVASASAIKSQFKRINRLLKQAQAQYRPYSDAERRAIAGLIALADRD
jgi:hypothetical protein